MVSVSVMGDGDGEPCKNGSADRDAVFLGERADSSEPREPCFRWSWLFIPFIDSND